MTPDELYRRSNAAMPAWNDTSPDVAARRAHAFALLVQAAEAGHFVAMTRVAQTRLLPESFAWAERLAHLGEVSHVVIGVTSGDWPVERGLAVLASARAGVAWAEHALGAVYRLGMRRGDTHELIAATEGGWGWLPAAADPDAEGLVWWRRAAARGWAAASYALAALPGDPAASLAHLRDALRPDGLLTDPQRKAAAGLLAHLLQRTGAPIAEQMAAYEVLAEAGDGDALAWLGDRHRLGEGGPPDLERARSLYEAGAAKGSVPAYRELARLLEDTEPDRAQALYEQAAELGADPFSRDRLAEKFGLRWYARGKGGKKRSPTAKRPATKKATKKR